MNPRLFYILLFPAFLAGQTFKGELRVNGYRYELFLKLNPDSSFNFTRIYQPDKKKKTFIPPYDDSIAYFHWKAKKINDSTTFIAMENTYAISFLKYRLADGPYGEFILKEQKDSMNLVYDSVRLWLPPWFRLIYQDGTDTTYSQKASYEKNYRGDTSHYGRLCHIYKFPVNKNRFKKSKYVHFDVGLKHPESGLPLLFKVPRGFYPQFQCWYAQDVNFCLIKGRQGYYLARAFSEYDSWEGKIFFSDVEYFFIDDGENKIINKIEMKKISH